MSTQTSPGATFDPVAFKTTTREQWQAAAEPWHRWGDLIGDWLGEATETMFDLAGIAAGSRVLDVAAGAGEQSLRAARRVGPTGEVLATDIAPALLERAAADARAAGLDQRPHPGDRRRGPRPARRRGVRRRHQPGGADLLPGPAARARRDAARAAGRRPGRGGRLLDARAQRVLLAAGRDHPAPCPAAAAAARTARSVLPRRSRASWPTPSRRPASPTSRWWPSSRRYGCRRPRSACASSGSRSARCTR